MSPDPARLDPRRDFLKICSVLPSNYGATAVHCRAIVPNHVNAKIKTADELLRMIFLHVGGGFSLAQTVAMTGSKVAGGPDVSAYCLHIRMRAAGPYLASLVRSMLASTRCAEIAETCSDGYEIIAVDATAFSGRNRDGTDVRIHAALRLADLSVTQATALGYESGETFKRFAWEKGQLAVGDRGYCNAPGIAWVVDQGADVLVRVNRSALPMVDLEGEPVDLVKHARKVKRGAVRTKPVRISTIIDGETRTIEGRLIVTRLPDDKAEEARDRARKEQGTDVSATTLEMAAYVMLFTTSTTLTPERCLEIYRLRWQVELLFKRWKSICDFDKLNNERPDTILSWITAKLLLGLIVERFAGSQDELLSPRSPAITNVHAA